MSCRLAAVSLALVLAAPAAQAQETPDGLAGLLLRFFSPSNPVVLQAAPDPFSHAAHFVSQPSAQETLRAAQPRHRRAALDLPAGLVVVGLHLRLRPRARRLQPQHGDLRARVRGAARSPPARASSASASTHLARAPTTRFEGQDLRDGDIKLYLTPRGPRPRPERRARPPGSRATSSSPHLFLDLSNDTTVLLRELRRHRPLRHRRGRPLPAPRHDRAHRHHRRAAGHCLRSLRGARVRRGRRPSTDVVRGVGASAEGIGRHGGARRSTTPSRGKS